MNIKAIELITAVNGIKDNLNGISNIKVLLKIMPLLQNLEKLLEPINKSIDVVNSKYNVEENTEVKDGIEVYKAEIVRSLNKDLTAIYITEVELPKEKNKLTIEEIKSLPSSMYQSLYALYNYLT